MFPCTKCGICCRSLNISDIYKELDRGDGACMHFNELENLCRIYTDRPLICRIEEMHEVFYKEMTKEKYILSNLLACQQAQIKAGLPAEKIIKISIQPKGK